MDESKKNALKNKAYREEKEIEEKERLETGERKIELLR